MSLGLGGCSRKFRRKEETASCPHIDCTASNPHITSNLLATKNNLQDDDFNLKGIHVCSLIPSVRAQILDPTYYSLLPILGCHEVNPIINHPSKQPLRGPLNHPKGYTQ